MRPSFRVLSPTATPGTTTRVANIHHGWRITKHTYGALIFILVTGKDRDVLAAQGRWGSAWNRIHKRIHRRTPALLFGIDYEGVKLRQVQDSRQYDSLGVALGLRSGASEVKQPPKEGDKSKKAKVSKKENPKNANRPTAGIFELTPLSESSSSFSSSPMLEVKALLTDRVINWKTMSRCLLGVMIYMYVQQCTQTAGIPRRQAVWMQLKNAGLLPSDEGPTPDSFRPTPLDLFLAEILARSARDMIPPWAMPSGRPLVGALLSCLAWVLITVLLPHWLLSLRIWYDYHSLPTPLHEPDVKGRTPTAALVEVSQRAKRYSSSQKKPQMVCKLHATSLRNQMEHGMPPFYFEHNHRRYYYEPISNQCWDGGPNLGALTLGELASKATKVSKGKGTSSPQFRGLLHAPSQFDRAQDRWYAYNHQASVPIPTIRQALWERLKSPLVVIQLAGKAVAVLEDGKAAFLALGQTVFQHYHNARSMIRSSKTLQKDVAGLSEEFSKQLVWIHRTGGGWKLMEASNLLPGDLFLMTTSSSSSTASTEKTDPDDLAKASLSHNQNAVVPVDALVLEGLCVTMEAVLTGESVPQTKMPFDSTMPEWKKKVDMMGTHRSSIVFAGTSILHCMPGGEEKKKQLPEPGVLCLALRTGSYSSKGELINALTASGDKAGVATISNAQFDRDSLRMIAIMSFLSTLACASLLLKPTGLHHKVSGFRRLIQCTRIASACIPSDLPLSLSYVVQSCANVLRKEADVVCSQPGALLTSADIDMVVFDKTGTITADTQSLSKVVLGPEAPAVKTGSNQTSCDSTIATQQSTPFQLVLAGCHSLVQLEEGKEQAVLHESHSAQASSALVGDPLELAGFNWLGTWSFNSEGYFEPLAHESKELDSPNEVVKLWQLKVFPFSPRVRLSSALCLAKHGNGEFKLWALVKGAPEAVEHLLKVEEMGDKSPPEAANHLLKVGEKGDKSPLLRNWYNRRVNKAPVEHLLKVEETGYKSPQFGRWYKRRVKKLESRGFRTLAMASRVLQPSDAACFNTPIQEDCPELEIVEKARTYASDIHRSDLEDAKGLSNFCGFACFDAKVRPSSKRIIHELDRGNVHSMMLTGDSLGAALAVARRVEILNESKDLALLEASPSSENGSNEPGLQWRITSLDGQQEKVIRFTRKTTSAILKKAIRGELSMATTGTPLMTLIAQRKGLPTYKQLVNNLACFSVVARASPECKESLVGFLSNTKRVLMCGDGVNDVSAMKEADVSVALLNGFGTESEQSIGDGKDIQDEKRKQRLHSKRRVSWGQRSAPSSAASLSRIHKQIEAAQEKITQGALKRQGLNGTYSGPVPYTLSDTKEMLSSALSAAMEERRRNKKLQDGGGEAATILLEDDILLTGGLNTTSASVAKVRPGEACMASPFSCLRSSIDGVEAVLRAGVATAACILSIQQKMSLNLLLTCFNLSALYRDGFRYGKHMAAVEFALYMLVEQLSFRESCKMRPRLPSSKGTNNISLFDPASLISVVSQTIVHIAMMQTGIVFARNVESQAPAGQTHQSKPLIRVASSQTPKLAVLLGKLITDNANKSEEDANKAKSNFLRQPKFVPNYESNVVFTMSLIQGTLTTLLMHKGAPFYVSVLESPQLCLWSGLSVLLAVACMLETSPALNSMLELRPWAAQRHKAFVLGLAILDSFACSVIECYCRWWASRGSSARNNNKRKKVNSRRRTARAAADLEEQALQEESRKNGRLVLAFIGGVGAMALDAILKAAFGVAQ